MEHRVRIIEEGFFLMPRYKQVYYFIRMWWVLNRRKIPWVMRYSINVALVAFSLLWVLPADPISVPTAMIVSLAAGGVLTASRHLPLSF